MEKFCLENPDADGVVLESHGLFTWGDTAKACYDKTIEVINTATAWLTEKTADTPIFGGIKHTSLSDVKRQAIAARLMPAIRGFVSESHNIVGHFIDSDTVREVVN